MELLQRLIETAAVPGREHRLRELIRGEIEGLFDETRVDALGSLICIRRPRPRGGDGGRGASSGTDRDPAPLRVMLAAHMDQIGFLVKHIDDKGYLRLNAVGGFDTRNLFARLVTVCPDVTDPKKDLPGVLNPAGKPVHIADEADKSKVPKLEEFYVDLGLPAEAVRERVKIGDMVVLRPTFERVGTHVVGQAMDNRVACWLAIQAMRGLASAAAAGEPGGAADAAAGHACEIHCVFTVQEEIGSRGAGAASYHIDPDITVSLDTTLAVDTPGVPEEQRVSKLGDGAGLLVMDSSMMSDVALLEDFERVARDRAIKTQRTILPRGGNDGHSVQLKRAGRRVFTLVCPTRYIHTVTEMVALTDLYACRDLLIAYLRQVGGNT